MKLILAAALAAIAAPVAAQDASVHLKDGATWTITAEHTRAAPDAGPAQTWSLTTVKRLTWHAPAKGSLATLTVAPISATPGPSSPPEVAQARSLAIPVTLAVEQDLTPKAVLNKEEVRAEFRRLVPRAADADVAIIDASASAMALSELGVMVRAQGLPLKPGQPFSASGALPNPLGGPPIRTVETVELKTIDKVTGHATLTWRQIVDPTSFKASIVALLDRMAQQAAPNVTRQEIEAAFKDASYQNDTDCQYLVDVGTGLAIRGECRMTMAVVAQGKSQRATETWAVTQSLPGSS